MIDNPWVYISLAFGLIWGFMFGVACGYSDMDKAMNKASTLLHRALASLRNRNPNPQLQDEIQDYLEGR